MIVKIWKQKSYIATYAFNRLVGAKVFSVLYSVDAAQAVIVKIWLQMHAAIQIFNQSVGTKVLTMVYVHLNIWKTVNVAPAKNVKICNR